MHMGFYGDGDTARPLLTLKTYIEMEINQT